MDELPNLLIELICEYLNYNDLLNLRSTCKNLKQFIDQKEFRKLYLFVNRNHSCHTLFYKNETVCYPNSFKINNLQILNSFKFKKNFDQIQKLIVFGQCGLKINLSELNHLTQLLHLEIQYVTTEGKLSLNNLKILAFRFDWTLDDLAFELDCPNLIALGINSRFIPKLISGENSLKYLCIEQIFEISFDYLFDLYSKLQNLSTICFTSFELLNHFLVQINLHRLHLRSLKKIKLERIFSPFSREFDRDELSSPTINYQLLNFIENLSTFIKNLSTNHIQIFINNQPTNLKEIKATINECLQVIKPTIVFYDDLKRSLENSNALECLLPQIKEIELRENAELDEKMIKKMKRLREIYIDCELNKSTFQNILKIGPKLETLYLDKLNFESNELDQIPKYLPYLTRLAFFKSYKFDNFDFIGKLKNLSELIFLFEIQLKREVLTYFFDNCLYLSEFDIKGKFQYIRISIDWSENEKKKYKISCDNDEGKQYKSKKYYFDNLNSLIDFFYEKNLLESEFIE